MSKRPPNMTEKLAATLLELQRLRGDPINREIAKDMTAAQICSLFHFDHYPIRREMGGSVHPTNLDPKLIPGHRKKTFEIDIPEIAHNRKVDEAQDNFRRKMLAKTGGDGLLHDRPPTTGKIIPGKSRAWPKRAMFSGKQKETMRKIRADKVAERRLRRKGQ